MRFGRSIKNKYGAVKTKVDGHFFPSKLEAEVYLLLKARMSLGEITEIKLQPTVKWEIVGPYKSRTFKYKPDFEITMKNGETRFVEAKGVETERFRRIKKDWPLYELRALEIYKRQGKKIYLTEILQAVKVESEGVV